MNKDRVNEKSVKKGNDSNKSHLEIATEIVRSWPEWKQTIIGPALPEHRIITFMTKK